jgi:predicted MFS family arabinose efflux permease
LDSATKLAAIVGVPLGTLIEGIGWSVPEFTAGGFAFAPESDLKPAEPIQQATAQEAQRPKAATTSAIKSLDA